MEMRALDPLTRLISFSPSFRVGKRSRDHPCTQGDAPNSRRAKNNAGDQLTHGNTFARTLHDETRSTWSSWPILRSTRRSRQARVAGADSTRPTSAPTRPKRAAPVLPDWRGPPPPAPAVAPPAESVGAPADSDDAGIPCGRGPARPQGQPPSTLAGADAPIPGAATRRA